MKIAKSIRLEESIVKIIDSHKGRSFTEKLEKIVLYADCFDHKVQLAKLQLNIKDTNKLYQGFLKRLHKLKHDSIVIIDKFNM